MMIVDITVGEEIKQLRRVGLRPTERLVRTITQAGPVAFSPLLELARDLPLLHEDVPECFAPLHALRLLGEMPTVAMINPLLELLPIQLEYEDEDLPKSFGSEVPQMIARLGAEAVVPLWAIADDSERRVPVRGGAMLALAYVVATAPEMRDAIVAGLRERLGSYDESPMNAYVAIALGELGVQDTYAAVMALYREGRLDRVMLPPGVARQMLMHQGEGRIACARHPLWERYDHHGPAPDEKTLA